MPAINEPFRFVQTLADTLCEPTGVTLMKDVGVDPVTPRFPSPGTVALIAAKPRSSSARDALFAPRFVITIRAVHALPLFTTAATIVAVPRSSGLFETTSFGFFFAVSLTCATVTAPTLGIASLNEAFAEPPCATHCSPNSSPAICVSRSPRGLSGGSRDRTGQPRSPR